MNTLFVLKNWVFLAFILSPKDAKPVVMVFKSGCTRVQKKGYLSLS